LILGSSQGRLQVRDAATTTVLRAGRGSPDPALRAGRGSPDPALRAGRGSPDPAVRAGRGSPDPAPGHLAAVLCLAASADGRYLASGSADQTLKLWDAATGQERATLRGHPSRVLAVAFSPDGERLVSGCYMRTLKMWYT